MNTVTYRPIDASPFAAVPPENCGERPQLAWLEISKLVIDDSYQRMILRRGSGTIRKIIQEFDWRKFSPVIVAPVNDLYAVVDGQHRTTAAAACGFETVPCQIVKASPTEQAAIFAAVNSIVTEMSPLQLHAARVRAEDKDALDLRQVCAAAGVEICRHPVPANNMKPGQTLAVGALRRALATYGARTLRIALSCITKSGDGNTGMIRAQYIKAICNVLDAEPAWMQDESKLYRAFDDFDFGGCLRKASRTGIRGAVLHGFLMKEIVAVIDAKL